MVNVLGTIAPKPRCEEIKAIQRRIRDETSGDEEISQVSGSLKELSVRPNPDADR